MLTPAEQIELAQLEAEEKQSLIRPPSNNLTPQEQAELEQLEAEEKFAMTQAPQAVNDAPLKVSQNEANLGLVNRAKYSIEPLESNRRAFLQQQFGAENVIENDKGELFLKQGNELRPINASGPSMADLAEFAGSTPEMAGAVIGGIAGFGPASIPGAAAGGAAGAVIRQGASALLGTPQIATPLERVTDVGLSAALSAGGQFIANKGKQFAKTLINKFRPAVGQNIDKAAKVIIDQNLGTPTLGQQIGPGSQIAKMEKDLANVPFFGKEIRKQFNEQADNVVKELKSSIGDFASDKFKREEVGANIKQLARGKVKFLHDASSALFEQVDEVAGNVSLPSKKLTNELMNTGKNLRLLTPSGELSGYNARSGLDEETFKQLQRTLSNVVRGIRNTADDNGASLVGQGLPAKDITIKELNLIRQSVTKTLSSPSIRGTNAERYLRTFEQSLLDLTESGLNKVDPTAGGMFKAARAGWAEFRSFEKLLDKSKLAAKEFGELSDDLVTRDMFKNMQSVIDYEKIVGKEAVREAAENHLAGIVRKSSKDLNSDFISSAQVLNALKNNESSFKHVFGAKKFNQVVDLLSFDKGLKLLNNPSGTDTTGMRSDLVKTLKRGVYLKTVLGVLKGGIVIPEKTIKAVARFSPQAQEFKRESSFFMRGPKPSRPEYRPEKIELSKEPQQTKRQRALSSEGKK